MKCHHTFLNLSWLVLLFFVELGTAEGSDPPKKSPKTDDDPAQALVGKKAPDLAGAFALNGRPVKLSQLRGKVVLLDFWAVWCVPCREMFPHLNAWHKELRDEGLVVLGVTTYYQNLGFDKGAGKLVSVGKTVENEKTGATEVIDGLTPAQEHDMLRAFAAHHKLRYRIMTLTKADYAKSSKDYHRDFIPQAVLIDRLGVVRMVRSGVSNRGIDALETLTRKLLDEK